MSSYKILNAINTAAASAFNSDGKTKAVKTVARFSVKAGVISVNAGSKALEAVAPFGVTENEYRAYCDNIKALYFDAVHLAHALESKNKAIESKDKAAEVDAKAAESKIRDIFYQDALALVHSMTDATFKVVPDVFETGAEVRDFEERCVAVLQKFVAGADGYDIEAVKISAFAKWVEPSIATRLSGVAMLSFEERDRRANLKKWVSKLARLEESLKTKRAEIEQAEKELAKDAERVAAGKMKESTYTRNEGKVNNIKAEAMQIETAIEGAKANIEKYKNQSTQYTADEFMPAAAVVVSESAVA